MLFYHYSSTDNISLDKSINYNGNRVAFKPSGFWFTPEKTVNDITWSDFCRDAGFNIIGLSYRYKINLDPTKILFLRNINSILEFTNEYKNGFAINWELVMDNYNGIVIVPYQQARKIRWYNPWDCASGCIWHMDNIISFEKDMNYHPEIEMEKED